jgi:hypothetical protein
VVAVLPTVLTQHEAARLLDRLFTVRHKVNDGVTRHDMIISVNAV